MNTFRVIIAGIITLLLVGVVIVLAMDLPFTPINVTLAGLAVLIVNYLLGTVFGALLKLLDAINPT